MLSRDCIYTGFAPAQAAFPGVSNSSDSSMPPGWGAFLYAQETEFDYGI